MGEPDGYRVGVALCRSGVSAAGLALVHPSVGVSQTGDLTLLLSTRAFREMLDGTVFTYRGDVRHTDGSPGVLAQLPAVDWWADAPDPELLDPRPAGLRDAPPEIVLDPSASQADDWQAYWSVIDVGGRSARLRQVHNPTPTDHIAEILVVVTVRAGVVTYTPVTMERCGPDLTRLAGGLRRPPAGEPFRPSTGPSEPRPRPDRRTTLDVESGFRRVADPLEPRILSAAALEGARVRAGLSGDAGIPLDIAGALFSRPGFGGGFAGDAHCEVVTAWDVRDRQIWLDARFELRFPVFLGFGNAGPANTVRLPGAGRLGLRARLPILTYRFDAEPVATGPFEFHADGPLAGVGQGSNREWLERLMADHALALVRNSADLHRSRPDSQLRYAYGVRSRLSPDGYEPYVVLAMHPTHWSGPAPPDIADREPPYLAFTTFGPNPEALNLAVNLFVVESLLDKLPM
jgi:hypothetical protein